MANRAPLKAGLLFLLYVVAAQAGLWAARDGVVAAVWPAVGIAVALAVRWGRRYALAAAAADLATSLMQDLPWSVALPFAAGNTLAIALAATAIDPHRHRAWTPDLAGVARLALVGAVLATLPGAVVGSVALHAQGLLADRPLLSFLAWWLSDAVAVVTVTPALLLLRRDVASGWAKPEARMLLGFSLVASLAAFLIPASALVRTTLVALLFPVLLAITARHRRPLASLALLGAAGAALLGFGSLDGPDTATILAIQVLLAVEGAAALALAAVLTDVERLAQQSAQREAQAQATAEQARFRRHFLASAAHELGNAVTPMRLHLAALRHTGTLPGFDVGPLQRSGERVAHLVRDMQAAANEDRATLDPRVEPANLAAIAREVVAALTPQALAANVQLTAEAPAEVPLRVDAHRIQQAIENLVANAIKYSPQGGAVTVRVEAGPDEARLGVQDAGLGFSADQRGRLFEPFSRLHKATQPGIPGTGLGLFIVRQIVEAHGGRVEAASQGPGHGATFGFTLPTVAAPSAPPPADVRGGAPTPPPRNA